MLAQKLLEINYGFISQMTWLAPKVLCAFAHNVNHFQMLIQIGRNCIYTDSRVDYGADLKRSWLREFSIF